jgi:hypothetical protein
MASTGANMSVRRASASVVISTDTALSGIGDMKDRQRAKIKELRHALVDAGLCTLDEQAATLGLSRSTTWAILQCNHKGSGLSASIINRMLESDRLPPSVRAKVLEYVQDKAAGLFGDADLPLRKFKSRMRWPVST